MTVKIHRKEAGADFEIRVEAFRQAKLAHHKIIGVPAPAEHPRIEAALKRVPRGDKPDDYVADFEIIEPTLEEKKQNLDHELYKARDAALHAKMSSAKRRLFAYQVADILAKPEHTDDDRAVLSKHQQLIEHQEKTNRHAARMHAQVEDLTEATIDTWKPEPFPAA